MVCVSLTFSPTLLFLFFFCLVYGVSGLPEPQLELGCGLLQRECWPWLCPVFQAQRPVVI